MSSPSKRELLERLFKAKETMDAVNHSMSCPVESDPEGWAPCNCKEKDVKPMRSLIEDTINYLLER